MTRRELENGGQKMCLRWNLMKPGLIWVNQAVSSFTCQLVHNSCYTFSLSTSSSQVNWGNISLRQNCLSPSLNALCDCPNILRANHIWLAVESPQENERENVHGQAWLCPFKFSPLSPQSFEKSQQDLVYPYNILRQHSWGGEGGVNILYY